MTPAQRRASAPRELARASDRISFIYLERCTVHRDSNAVTAEDADGIRHIPVATIGTLLLGPGTRVTHQAMSLLGDAGARVVWVGENGVRYYAGGRALTRSAALAEAQARLWANRATRLQVAREMYRIRFPGLDVDSKTRQQLLGHEGNRIDACYRAESKRTGVPWHGRHYIPGDFSSGDAPNQGITAAAHCLYGVAQTVVGALGLSPSLGFVHSQSDLAFALDVADLYRSTIAVPVAFDVAKEGDHDVGARTRRAMRDLIYHQGLLDRCVRDVKALIDPAGETVDMVQSDSVGIRTDRGPDVDSGWNHGGGGQQDEWGEPPEDFA